MALTRPRAYQIYDIDYKQATRVVTVSNITLSGGAPSQVDGVNLSLNDRVLVVGQSTLAENGIYYVTTVGAGSNGTWARSSDTNTTGELLSGTIVMVTEGNTYADTQWKLTTNDPIVIGVSDLVFVQNYLANTISSGNSNVEVNANSTIDFSVAGVADVLVITSTGANVAGYVSATGNITGNYIIGNGSQLTGLPESYSNANVDSHLAAFGSNTISTTGNITGGYFIGNGSQLTSLTGANVTGTVANATYATSAGTATSATTAGTVTTNAQPNITEVGTLTSVSVSGNTQSGNLLTAGLVSATGNITGNYFIGNGSQLTGLPATYGNTEVAAYLPTYTGNLSPGNLTTGGLISATGNITAGNILATNHTGTTVSVSGTVTSASVVGGVMTGTSLSASGNVTGGNVLTDGLISSTGNITGGNVSGTNLTGTLTTAAQTNITSVGTLSSLSVSGNVQGGNLRTAGLISATGDITGNTLLAGGISLTGNTITSTNTTITIDPNSAGGIDGAVIIAGNLSVQGNVTYIDSNVITTNEKSITLANNVNTGAAADGSGIDVGNNNLAYWRFNNATTSWQSNIGLTPAANATLNLGGGSNYWATIYATGVNISGNITGGNVLTGGLISATGNITGGNISATNHTGTTVSVSGTVTGASVVGGVMTGTSLSASGNVTGGNITTAGLISATGNITGGNLSGTSLTGTTVSVTGNVQGGNLRTAGLVSATGNITGNYFIGNGSQLTGITAGNSFSPIVVSGQSNVTANSSATALTYVAGYGVILNTDNSLKTVTYALDPFAIGGSFGTVTESATTNTTLGTVTEAVTVSYDLGTAVASSVDLTNVTSNIIPVVNATYNLGNATNQWQDLYLSGNIVSSSGPSSSAILSNWGYSGLSFSVAAQEKTPTGIFFKSDGTEMYVCGSTGDDVNQYTLSSAWDVSSATYTAVSTGITQDTAPAEIFFKPDGLTLYVLGGTNDTVYQYTLSSAWNITTATYASLSFSVTSQESAPTGMFFSSDGTKMYITGTGADSVFQYTLGTAWNVSTASYDSISLNISAQSTTPYGLGFNSSGTQMFVNDYTNDKVWQYNLGTAWDLSTAAVYGYFIVYAEESTNAGIYIADTQNKAYVVGSTVDAVFQYNTNATAVSFLSNNVNFSNTVTVNNWIQGNSIFVSGVAILQSTTTVSGTLTAAGAFTASTTTGAINIHTSQTTGILTVGGTAATGVINIGRSTANQSIVIGNGVTASGSIKTIDIGTLGASGSNTNITIGSATSGARTTITMNGNASVTGNITGSYILGNGSQLTGITAGVTTGKSLAITLIMGG